MAPKNRSLPQLELLGAVVGLQALGNILRLFNHVDIRNVYLALDAQVALSWILSPIKVKNVYSANRIKDVKEMLDDIKIRYSIEVQLKYVPTLDNPGDLLTRGLSLTKFKTQLEFWIHGPDWIRSPEVLWPSSEFSCLSSASKQLVMSTVVEETRKPLISIVPFDRYSSLTKLFAVTSRMIEFCHKLGIYKEDSMKKSWGSKEFNHCAKLHLVSVMQNQCFSEEIDFLKSPENMKVPSRVRDMNLFLDSYGILRSYGRMGKVECFSDDIKNPILLGKSHMLTTLIVEDCHRRVRHLGIQATLNKVRYAGFRVISPYQTIKTIIHPCPVCRKFNSLSYNYPRMTELPKHRVNMVRPFCHLGVDYTGHIYCKEGDKEVKMYILLFTCMNVRAIHIELIPEMSTNHFVLAMVRFCNEYGIPSTIYSDNAKSFISGVHVLEQVFTSAEFKENFGIYDIQHIKIPLYSPWVGSTWERLIKTVKDCLKKTIGRAILNYFRLVTVLSDIQQAINIRPLTYRCAANGSLEVLTPNHFLKPYAETSLLIKNPKDKLPSTLGRRNLVKSLEIRDRLLDKFKALWYEEYLLGLKETFKDLHESKFENRIKVGDIVLVKNPAVKRQHWVLGRIIEVYPGADGKIRSVKLLRGKADYRDKPAQPELHSLKHLYPLELSITHDHVASPDSYEINNLDGEVVEECDFREPEDIPHAGLGTSANSPSLEALADTSLPKESGGELAVADVNLPSVDVDLDPPPAFLNEYRHRAVSRRSRPIRAPQRLLKDYLFFE